MGAELARSNRNQEVWGPASVHSGQNQELLGKWPPQRPLTSGMGSMPSLGMGSIPENEVSNSDDKIMEIIGLQGVLLHVKLTSHFRDVNDQMIAIMKGIPHKTFVRQDSSQFVMITRSIEHNKFKEVIKDLEPLTRGWGLPAVQIFSDAASKDHNKMKKLEGIAKLEGTEAHEAIPKWMQKYRGRVRTIELKQWIDPLLMVEFEYSESLDDPGHNDGTMLGPAEKNRLYKTVGDTLREWNASFAWDVNRTKFCAFMLDALLDTQQLIDLTRRMNAMLLDVPTLRPGYYGKLFQLRHITDEDIPCGSVGSMLEAIDMGNNGFLTLYLKGRFGHAEAFDDFHWVKRVLNDNSSQSSASSDASTFEWIRSGVQWQEGSTSSGSNSC